MPPCKAIADDFSSRPTSFTSFISRLCLALTWYGAFAAFDSYDMGERSNTALGFPLWLYYSALPVSAGLMSMRYARRLWQFCFAFDPATMEVHSGRE